jgi:hypothetical protein
MHNVATDLYYECNSKISTSPLSEILPILIRLANEINNIDLKRWASLELAGYYNTNPEYTKEATIPEYRKVPGRYYNAFGQYLNITNTEQRDITQYIIPSGVPELERYSKSQSDVLKVESPKTNDLIKKLYNFDAMYYIFTPASIEGILGAIRLKAIDWLREIKPQIDALKVENNINSNRQEPSISSNSQNDILESIEIKSSKIISILIAPLIASLGILLVAIYNSSTWINDFYYKIIFVIFIIIFIVIIMSISLAIMSYYPRYYKLIKNHILIKCVFLIVPIIVALIIICKIFNIII